MLLKKRPAFQPVSPLVEGRTSVDVPCSTNTQCQTTKESIGYPDRDSGIPPEREIRIDLKCRTLHYLTAYVVSKPIPQPSLYPLRLGRAKMANG